MITTTTKPTTELIVKSAAKRQDIPKARPNAATVPSALMAATCTIEQEPSRGDHADIPTFCPELVERKRSALEDRINKRIGQPKGTPVPSVRSLPDEVILASSDPRAKDLLIREHATKNKYASFHASFEKLVETIILYQAKRKFALEEQKRQSEANSADRDDDDEASDDGNLLQGLLPKADDLRKLKDAFLLAMLTGAEKVVDNLEEHEGSATEAIQQGLRSGFATIGRSFADLLGVTDPSDDLSILYKSFCILKEERKREVPTLSNDSLTDVTKCLTKCLQSMMSETASLLGPENNLPKRPEINLGPEYQPVLQALKLFNMFPTTTSCVSTDEFFNRMKLKGKNIWAPKPLIDQLQTIGYSIIQNTDTIISDQKRQLVLLEGPPGTGKSMAIEEVMSMTGAPFSNVSIANLVAQYNRDYQIEIIHPLPANDLDQTPEQHKTSLEDKSPNTDKTNPSSSSQQVQRKFNKKPKLSFSEYLKRHMIEQLQAKDNANVVFLLDDWHALFQLGGPYQNGENASDLVSLLNFIKDITSNSSCDPFGSERFCSDDPKPSEHTAKVQLGGARISIFITSNESIKDRIKTIEKVTGVDFAEVNALFSRAITGEYFADEKTREKIGTIVYSKIVVNLAKQGIHLDDDEQSQVLQTIQAIQNKDLSWYKDQAPGTVGFRGLAFFLGNLEGKCKIFETDRNQAVKVLEEFREEIDEHFSNISAYSCEIDPFMREKAALWILGHEIVKLGEELESTKTIAPPHKQRVREAIDRLKNSPETASKRRTILASIRRDLFDAYRQQEYTEDALKKFHRSSASATLKLSEEGQKQDKKEKLHKSRPRAAKNHSDAKGKQKASSRSSHSDSHGHRIKHKLTPTQVYDLLTATYFTSTDLSDVPSPTDIEGWDIVNPVGVTVDKMARSVSQDVLTAYDEVEYNRGLVTDPKRAEDRHKLRKKKIILLNTESNALPEDPKGIMEIFGAPCVVITDNPLTKEGGSTEFDRGFLERQNLNTILQIKGCKAKISTEGEATQCTITKEGSDDGYQFAIQKLDQTGKKLYLTQSGIKAIVDAGGDGDIDLTGSHITSKEYGSKPVLNIFSRYFAEVSNKTQMLGGAIILDIRTTLPEIISQLRPKQGEASSPKNLEDDKIIADFLQSLSKELNRTPQGIELDRRGISLFVICKDEDVIGLSRTKNLSMKGQLLYWPQRTLTNPGDRLAKLQQFIAQSQGVDKERSKHISKEKTLSEAALKEFKVADQIDWDHPEDYRKLLMKFWHVGDNWYLEQCKSKGLKPESMVIQNASEQICSFLKLKIRGRDRLCSQSAQCQESIKKVYTDAIKRQEILAEQMKKTEEKERREEEARLQATARGTLGGGADGRTASRSDPT